MKPVKREGSPFKKRGYKMDKDVLVRK
jgi:hypothetical protein